MPENPRPIKRYERGLDVWNLVLLLIGVGSVWLAYGVVESGRGNPLFLVPGVVLTTLSGTHLVKTRVVDLRLENAASMAPQGRDES